MYKWPEDSKAETCRGFRQTIAAIRAKATRAQPISFKTEGYEDGIVMII